MTTGASTDPVQTSPLPVVSVVIPTHRASPYLLAAMASVEAQDLTEWELIVIDDGCSEPHALRQLLASAPEHQYRRQDPAGPSVARNHGAAIALGEFVAFLDDDDLWHPERLKLQVEAMREHPDALVCYSGGWHLDGEGRSYGIWPAELLDQRRMLSGELPIPRIQTMMWSREAFHRCGGFNSALTLGEDTDLTIRALQLGKFCVVDQPLAAYRRYEGNISAVPAAEMARAGEISVRYQLESARARARRDPLSAEHAALLAQNLQGIHRFASRAAAADMVEALFARRWRWVWPNLTYWVSRDPLRGVLESARVTVALSRRALRADS